MLGVLRLYDNMGKEVDHVPFFGGYGYTKFGPAKEGFFIGWIALIIPDAPACVRPLNCIYVEKYSRVSIQLREINV